MSNRWKLHYPLTPDGSDDLSIKVCVVVQEKVAYSIAPYADDFSANNGPSCMRYRERILSRGWTLHEDQNRELNYHALLDEQLQEFGVIGEGSDVECDDELQYRAENFRASSPEEWEVDERTDLMRLDVEACTGYCFLGNEDFGFPARGCVFCSPEILW